MTVGIFFFGY